MAPEPKTTSLTVRSKAPIASADALISQAIDKNVSVETMEKLLVLRDKLMAEQAKREFNEAMAKFQKECPIVQKKKKVLDKDKKTTRYSYAPLEDIVEQVKPYLAKHGFSYSLKPVQTDKEVGAACTATHIGGHSEVTTFMVPVGTEQFMSDVQKYGARLTFSQRYAFRGAFGITVADEDTDATDTGKSSAPASVRPIPATTIEPRMSYDQQKKIFAMLIDKGKVKADLDDYIMKAFKRDHLTMLTVREAKITIDALSKLPDSQPIEVAATTTEEAIDLDAVDAGIKKQEEEEARRG